MIYSKVLMVILQALAPILPLTTQEAYSHIKATNGAMFSKDLLPSYSVKESQLPQTVYQLNWIDTSDLNIDENFLNKFDTFDMVDQLAILRSRVLDQLETEPVWGILKHDLKRAELQFSLTKAPQEVEGEPALRLENIMETLGDDLSDFFFGCPIRGI